MATDTQASPQLVGAVVELLIRPSGYWPFRLGRVRALAPGWVLLEPLASDRQEQDFDVRPRWMPDADIAAMVPREAHDANGTNGRH